MVAKRALDFGTPRPTAKRRKATNTVYRGKKLEMKDNTQIVSHIGATASNVLITSVANGAAENERIGAKIKSWAIEGYIVTNQPVRLDLVIPSDVGGTPTPPNAFHSVIDTEDFTRLGTWYYNNNTPGTYEGMHFVHKLPYGVVTKFNGVLGTDGVKNPIYARITNQTSATVLGQFRLFYTDG